MKRAAELARGHPGAALLGMAMCAPAVYAAYQLVQALT